MTAINSNRAIRGPVTAVPVVAGKGVRLVADTENNRIVAEVDETVLYNNTNPSVVTSNTDFDLSEPVRNFDRVKVYYKEYYGPDSPNGKFNMCSEAIVVSDTFGVGIPGCATGDNNNVFFDVNGCMFDSAKPSKITVVSTGKRIGIGINGTSATFSTTNDRGISLFRVVGINRVASA